MHLLSSLNYLKREEQIQVSTKKLMIEEVKILIFKERHHQCKILKLLESLSQ